MRTNIRIERVVLDGLRLSPPERAALAPAIAAELRRLAGQPADEPAGRPAGPRPAGSGPSVERIAREVAAALHRAIRPVVAARPTAPPAALAAPTAPAALAAPVAPTALAAPAAPAAPAALTASAAPAASRGHR